ncbi:MAG: hypothetical protein ACOX0X_01405 [Candidatus Dojkabacteria bacterium]|jgi:uncharacterized repeat protein (TIGR01451 family)
MATTRSRTTKRALRVLLIIGGILILALIGAVVYFYAIKDSKQPDDIPTELTCGCYLIDPAIVNDCGDPKKAISFTTKSVPADQACSAQCDSSIFTRYTPKSSTPEASYKSCTVRSIADARCKNMIILDQDGKLVTGKVNPTDSIKVEATFDKSDYMNYSFTVNSENQEPDETEGATITKTISDLSTFDSIDIAASATDKQGNTINSIICRRVVEIEKEGGVGANAISATTEKQSDGSTRISKIIISIGQLTSENVKITFSFGNKYPTLVMKDGLNIEAAKGTITISKANLYDPSNFVSPESFAVLDTHTGELTITAEVHVDNSSVGKVSTDLSFVKFETPTLEQPAEEPEEEKSNFSVSKTSTPQCVERVAEKNTATFTITIKNAAATDEEITYIKDKLPLGFQYVANSSTINGQPVKDSDIVKVTTVGSTQEIVWQQQTPWKIATTGQLVLIFKALAGAEAITGENMNEVIVNPVKIPTDPATLRSEAVITVAQDCTNITPTTKPTTPATGIFDHFITRIIVGIVLFITAWLVYTRPEGSKLSEMILNSEVYKDVQLTKYRLTNPKKYFEEKIIREQKSKTR